MATYTYVFSPNTRIKSAEVNQNFNEIWVLNWGTVWTPTYGSDATWGSITTYVSQYTQIGKVCIIQCKAIGTTAGGATDLRFSLPITPFQDDYAGDVGTACTVYNNGNYTVGSANYDPAQSKILVRQIDGVAWGNTTGNGFSVNLAYQVA